jgi:hypothetical protein
MRGVLSLLVLLTASVALAQYAESEEPPKLKGTSRISVMGGWRYAPNFKFYDRYYSRADARGMERARSALGGPSLTGTFAYSVAEPFELGIDLFTTYERIELTDQPGLNAVTYGALIGLRFQKRLQVGREGLIPFGGLLIGPLIAAAFFDGGRSVERNSTALGLSVGATWRLTPQWGVCFEFRQIIAGGDVEDFGSYNAGGSWLSVGMTYVLPWEDERKIRGRL